MTYKPPMVFALLVMVPLLLTAQSWPAKADSHQALSQVSGELLTLTQQMTQGVLLAALGVEKAETMERLTGQVQRFEQRLVDIQSGEGELKSADFWPDELASRFERIEFLWGQYRAALDDAEESDQIVSGQIEMVANLEDLLADSIRQFVEGATSSSDIAYHSLYLNTVRVARQQAVLSQKLLKELLLVANDHEVAENQRNLNESYSRLDRSFQALIHGDSELQLIAPPTADVERRWSEAREIWLQFRSTIKEAARSGDVPDDQLPKVVGQSQELLATMNSAIDAYRTRQSGARK